MPDIRIAWINLRSRTERRDAFLANNGAELDASGFPWRRVDGVDGGELATSTTSEALIARGIIAREGLPDGYLPHTWGHLGCALSHRSQWEEAARSEEGDVLVILEDDAEVCPQFGAQLRRALDLATQRGPWDVLHFGFNPDVPLAMQLDCPRMEVQLICMDHGRPVEVGARFPVIWPQQPPAGEMLLARVLDMRSLCGYAVTARGARRLLDGCFPMSATSIDGSISRKLREEVLTSLVVLPPLVMSPNDHTVSDTVHSPSSRYNESI